MFMKKAFCILLSICILGQGIIYASDSGDYEEYSEANTTQTEDTLALSAKSAILMEETTGKILYQKNPHEKLPLASVTKIMTMLLVMEQIESGTIKMNDTVTTSTHASSMGGSQIWLKEGETMTIHDLLKATAIASANDAAMTLAEHVGGSEEGFVSMMNNKAAELGMNNTVFVNPTGLDADGHYSSAYDIALMSRALLSHQQIIEFTTVWMDSLRDGKTELVNTNKLVRFYKGATGLKTGTTDGAGSCISATAQKGEMSLISVVMGCKTSAERFSDARALLDFGFSHYMMYQTVISKEVLQPVKVAGGTQRTVAVDTTVCDKIIIPAGKEKSVEENVSMFPEIEAPVTKGQKLGEVTLSIDGEIIATFEIKACEAVNKMTFGYALGSIFKKAVCE